MIDCLRCYNLKFCGGVYYCPFAGSNPCIRGEHTQGEYVPPKVEPKEPPKETPCENATFDADTQMAIDLRKKGLTLTEIGDTICINPNRVRQMLISAGVNTSKTSRWLGQKPPKYVPYDRELKKSIDWEKIHEEIFTGLSEGKTTKSIAKGLGIKADTLRNYIRKYVY